MFLKPVQVLKTSLRGSVFKIVFRVLAREFESIETSSGFDWFLGENWV